MEAGWTLKRIKGSHHIFGKPSEWRIIAVPFTAIKSLSRVWRPVLPKTPGFPGKKAQLDSGNRLKLRQQRCAAGMTIKQGMNRFPTVPEAPCQKRLSTASFHCCGFEDQTA